MDFRILGELEVVSGGGPLDLGSPRQRALLARLLVSANEVVASDRLLEDLWPYDMPDTARQVLHVYVSRIRRSLGDERDRLERRGSGYCLRVEPRELDAESFAALAAAGSTAMADGDSPRARTCFHDALALWRGPALFEFPDDPFAREEAVRLERMKLDVVEQRIWTDLEDGRAREVIAELHDLVAEHPLREGFWEQLMLALYRSGQQAEALRAYDSARLHLATELGIEPGPSLQSLELRILNQDPSLDLGTSEPPIVAPSPLPAERTSFVGRAPELERAAALLERSRLLTIVGPPGAGKTRLALRLAVNVAPEFPEGAYLVPLASVRDIDFVLSAIVAELGVQAEEEDAFEALGHWLSSRQLLLLLDNFEQVVDVAPVIGRLLDVAPGLKVIVTSRIPLGIAGEQRFPIPPMSMPPPGGVVSPEAMDGFDAVRLFVDRVQLIDPSFQLDARNNAAVGSIVRQLGGLPLAIELAAARVQDIPLVDMVKRLDDVLGLLTDAPRDVDERHQTMEAAIRWSADLLEPSEQRAFRSLGVFMGGFTLDAASSVLGCDPDEAGRTVEQLVAHSLVERPQLSAGSRYGMLELVREFAVAELEAHGEASCARSRHARYFADLAGSMESSLAHDPSAGSADRLHAELGNIRAALWHATNAPDADVGLDLAAAIWRFWLTIDQLDEGRRWLEGLLALDSATRAARARGLMALGGITYWQEEAGIAREMYVEALDLFRQSGDRHSEAQAMYALAVTANFLGESEACEAYAISARELFEAEGDAEGVGGTLMAEGASHWFRDDHRRALDLYEDALSIARATDDAAFAVTVLVGIGALEYQLGNRDRGREVMVQVVEEAAAIENAHSLVWGLDVLAAISVDVDPIGAVTIGGAADALRRKAGGGLTSETIRIEGARAAASTRLDPDSIGRAWQEGSSLSIDEAVARARVLGVVAESGS